MTDMMKCVFCGEQMAHVQPTILSCITSIASYRIFCDSCYATGGEHETASAAIEEWERVLAKDEKIAKALAVCEAGLRALEAIGHASYTPICNRLKAAIKSGKVLDKF
jgi:hypothetical protein